MAAEWVVPVYCGDDVYSVVGSADGSVAAVDHRDGADDGSSCRLAEIVLARAVEAAPSLRAAVAGAVYYLRQARRAHPRGGWDDGHRWCPDEAEWRDCCANIRPPSRAWPWSLMVHGRTAVHVAALYDIESTALRRVARAITSDVGSADSHREP